MVYIEKRKAIVAFHHKSTVGLLLVQQSLYLVPAHIPDDTNIFGSVEFFYCCSCAVGCISRMMIPISMLDVDIPPYTVFLVCIYNQSTLFLD
jgi:hypothetical protein